MLSVLLNAAGGKRPPQVFGWQHLLYLGVVAAIAIAAFWLIAKKY